MGFRESEALSVASYRVPEVDVNRATVWMFPVVSVERQRVRAESARLISVHEKTFHEFALSHSRITK